MDKKEFLDKKIIEMMNEVEQPAAQSEIEATTSEEIKPEERTIYTGLKIKGEWTYFKPQLFAENKITVMIPENFVQMDAASAKKKYPSEQRPDDILTNKNGSVNLLFEYMEGKVANDEIEPLRNHVFGMMKRVNPGIKKHHSGTEMVSGKTVAYVEFSNLAMDGKLYNLLYFIEVDEQILMVSFNCRSKDMNYWQKAAVEMMQSITFVEEDQVENEDKNDID